MTSIQRYNAYKSRLKNIIGEEVSTTMEVKTVYFEKHGPGNTDDVLRLARQRAEE
jgi:hypothetical protein